MRLALVLSIALVATAFLAFASPGASAARPCTNTFPSVCVDASACARGDRYGCVQVNADCTFWGTCGPPP